MMINLTQTPKRLKQSILMEAMQGKLTKQLPSDGNASDLLVKIANYKRDLVQNGRLKRYSKPLPPVKNDEKPFIIPDNWEWTRLNAIGSWKSGATPKRSNKSYYHGNIPWLKVGDLNNNYITHAGEHISDEALNNSSMRINPKGSILVAMYAGEDIDKLGILKIAATTNQAICNCIPYLINNKFLFYYLMSQRSKFMSLGTGGAQSNISRTKIIHYPISIPPLAEQKRIVQCLDRILPKIDGLNKDVVRLHSIRKAFPHRLKQSLLMEAMQGKLTKQLPSDGTADELLQKIQQKKQALIRAGKIHRHKELPPISKDEIPFNIPSNWEWMRFSSLYDMIPGTQPKKRKCLTHPNKGFIRLYLIRDYGPNPKPLYMPVNKTKKISHTGDILVANVGGSLGKIFKAYNGAYNCHLDKVTPIIRNKELNRKYIWYYLQSGFYQLFISQLAYSKAGQASFNKRDLTHLIIPIPPLAEQKRIVDKLNSLFSRVVLYE